MFDSQLFLLTGFEDIDMPTLLRIGPFRFHF